MFQRVALDCLSYHATATDNDTNWLARESIPGPKDFNLYRWKMNFCSSWSYFFFIFSYKFNDTIYNDSKTLKIVIRMFLDFDLINKFSIPYKVSGIFSSYIPNIFCVSGCLSVGPQCEEELSSSKVSQLETRPQCLSDYVHNAQNWKSKKNKIESNHPTLAYHANQFYHLLSVPFQYLLWRHQW